MCEWEFKKRAEIVHQLVKKGGKQPKNGLKTQEKAHFGYLKKKES